MKKVICLLFVVATLLSFSSCIASHSGLTRNVNNSTTNVVLAKNNYRIIQKVKGTASGVRVFGFGGSFSPMIENARAEMLENSDLLGRARAVINETVETNSKSYVGVVTIYTVTVSAYVIEFTE